MVASSKPKKRSLQRRGKQLLKSKHTLYKKSKTTLLRMKHKSKILLSPTFVLPSTLQPLSCIKPNTIRTVNSTNTATVTKVASLSSPSSPFGNGSTNKSDLHQSTNNKENAGNNSEKKKPKKISIKKLFGGINKRLKSPRKKANADDGSSTTTSAVNFFRTKSPRKKSSDKLKSMANGSIKGGNIIISKHLETTIVLESTGSEETADTTNPNSPVRMIRDDDGEKHYGSDNVDKLVDANHDNSEEDNSIPSTEFATSAALSNDESHGPYIFLDTDDDEIDHYKDDDADSDHQACNDDGEKVQSAGRYTTTSVPNVTTVDQERQYYRRNFDTDISQEIIQARLEQELVLLEERIKNQREERRAIAKDQIEIASREDIDDESNTLQNNEKGGSSFATSEEKQRKTKRSSRVFVLLSGALLLMIYWLISKVWVTAPRYNQHTAIEQAKTFFLARNTEGPPMEGMTIILSETESELGSTIEDRFASLGATVESLEMIDCNDLNSVAESVDSLLEKLEKENDTIDFLIQTGNLCLPSSEEDHQKKVTKSVQSMTTKTVQGHDALFAGNYLSSFLVTQKILPRLEQSQFGTLVQFTSLASKLVDGSELDIEECPSTLSSLSCNSDTSPAPVASRLLQQQETYFSTLMHLPRQFAYVKLSEILQHEVITREFPNIRTMAISKGGWMIGGEGGADEFFHRIFQTKEETGSSISSSSPTKSAVIDDNNEYRREGLYEWSQNAVWKWVAAPPTTTPSPIAALILGSSGQQNVAAGSIARDETSDKSPSLVGNISTTMVTSGALALLAMKYPGFGIWRSSWWSE